VSSGAPSLATGRRASEAEKARAQQELANQMEAETVVLRQRITELTAMVERMQEELRAAEAVQRAREETAKAAPAAVDDASKVAPRAADEAANAAQTKPSSWSDQNWPLLAAIIGVPLLVAALLLRSRRQRQPVPRALPSTPVPDPTTLAPAPPAMELQHARAAAPATASPTVAAPATKIPRRTPERNSVSALAVSELLHATEEARVYVALGRPDRAIDVLNDHIKHVPRSLPAAWVMLLDLYSREQPAGRLSPPRRRVPPALQRAGAGMGKFRRNRIRPGRPRDVSTHPARGDTPVASAGLPRIPRGSSVRQSRGAPYRVPACRVQRDFVAAANSRRAPTRRHRFRSGERWQARAATEACGGQSTHRQPPRGRRRRRARPHPHEPPARPAQQPLDLGGNFDPAFARAKKA
jgi:hypothetical protein